MRTKIDKEGRATIPHHVRKNLNLQIGDYLEVRTELEQIIFQKVGQTCIICKSANDLREFESKSICVDCIKKIKSKKL